MAKTTYHCFTVKSDGRANVLTSPVKISSAFPLDGLTGQYSIDQIDHQDCVAIWDTGATGTVITEKVVQGCGLKPIGRRRVHTASGQSEVNVYLVHVFLPNRVMVPNVQATEGKIANAEVLIGMDIIGTGDFAVTNKDNKTAFSFRFPSKDCIDFVEQRPASIQPSPERNKPCPCGSGVKYKFCHGRPGGKKPG